VRTFRFLRSLRPASASRKERGQQPRTPDTQDRRQAGGQEKPFADFAVTVSSNEAQPILI